MMYRKPCRGPEHTEFICVACKQLSASIGLALYRINTNDGGVYMATVRL